MAHLVPTSSMTNWQPEALSLVALHDAIATKLLLAFSGILYCKAVEALENLCSMASFPHLLLAFLLLTFCEHHMMHHQIWVSCIALCALLSCGILFTLLLKVLPCLTYQILPVGYKCRTISGPLCQHMPSNC